MAEDREMLIVQSKVREAIRTRGGDAGSFRTSEEFLLALNEMVHGALDRAVTHARDSKRSTLKRQDL